MEDSGEDSADSELVLKATIEQVVSLPPTGQEQCLNPISDALHRLYSLFADGDGPRNIRKQSIVRDVQAILAECSHSIASPRDFHETDPAVELCSHHQIDSRLLQFQQSFGRKKVILDRACKHPV